MRSENGQLLMIPQQALAQMQAQAHAQAQPQTTMAPRPATPTSAPPVQISTVQVSTRPAWGGVVGGRMAQLPWEELGFPTCTPPPATSCDTSLSPPHPTPAPPFLPLQSMDPATL